MENWTKTVFLANKVIETGVPTGVGQGEPEIHIVSHTIHVYVYQKYYYKCFNTKVAGKASMILNLLFEIN